MASAELNFVKNRMKRVVKTMDYAELSSSIESGNVTTEKPVKARPTSKVKPPTMPSGKITRPKGKVQNKRQIHSSSTADSTEMPVLQLSNIGKKPDTVPVASRTKPTAEVPQLSSESDAAADPDDSSTSDEEDSGNEGGSMPNISDKLETTQSKESQGVASSERDEDDALLAGEEDDGNEEDVVIYNINNEEELLAILQESGPQPTAEEVTEDLIPPNLYVKMPDGVFMAITEEQILKTIEERQSLMVSVNVARLIVGMKNDISSIKHAVEMLAINSAGRDQDDQSVIQKFSFAMESLPVGTQEDFLKLCKAVKDDLPFRKHLKASMNLLGGTKLPEITRLILRALMSKALRLNYVAQKKNTGKKVFKNTSMWPFVLDAIRCRFTENKPDELTILKAVGTVFANSGDDEGGVVKRKMITAVRRAAGEKEKERLAALQNSGESTSNDSVD